jgi:hypothetical protein
MDNIEHAVDFIFQNDAEKRNIWHTMIGNYRAAMQILRKKSEYTDNEIDEFQNLIDDFFQLYVEVSGGGRRRG